MPIYEYQCEWCSAWTERQFKVEEMAEVTSCEKCGKKSLRKIKSAPNLAVPTHMSATGSVLQKHGIKNPVTGEGIKKNGKYT